VNTLLTVKLAHDLRNLLMIMASCVESIQAISPRHAAVDAELAFAELDGAIESAFAVSRELLALGRTPDAQRSIIDLNELVMQAQGVMRRMLGTRLFRTVLTRSDIAGYLGLSLEAVSRACRRLERSGIVAFVDRHQARVRDRRGLERLASAY
jgi:CRP-like cAMP-binding protein